VLVAIGGLAACTGVREVSVADHDARRSALLAVSDWEMRGRIAFQNGQEGGQAKLQWWQTGTSSRIRLSGPLGAGTYEINWEPGRVSVTDAGGEQSLEYLGVVAAEQFMRDQLGWSFPAGSTRYWIMGLLDPAADGHENIGKDGQLQGLGQYGWDIRYERFAEFDGYALPTKVELNNGSATLRIVVSRWQLAATDS
jgi:outer membrane lipoprotein LolB